MGCNQSTSARDTNFKGLQKHTLSAHIDKKKINKKDMKKIELEFLTQDLEINDVYPKAFLEEYTVLQEELGRGAMSIVIAAIHKKDGKKHAIKVVENPKLRDVIDMQREVKTLQMLNHPNILKAYKTFTKPGIFIIAAEFCDGVELFKQIVRMYRVDQDDSTYGFTERHASCIIRQVADALEYAHEKGIIHRDIKAENVLVGKEAGPHGNFGLVKLIDFGLAIKLKEGKTTYTDSPCGTPGYVPPEIVNPTITGDVEYTTRADVWSLGVLTYELICGYAPFYAEDQKVALDLSKTGVFEFHEHSWADVSQECKDTISTMLTIPVDTRKEISEVKKLPWLSDDIEKIEDFDLDVEDNLRHTLARKRWKKGMRLVMAVNRMKSKVKMLMNIQRATKAKAIGSPLTPRGTPKDIIVGGGFSLDDDDDDDDEEEDSHHKIKKSNTTA